MILMTDTMYSSFVPGSMAADAISITKCFRVLGIGTAAIPIMKNVFTRNSRKEVVNMIEVVETLKLVSEDGRVRYLARERDKVRIYR